MSTGQKETISGAERIFIRISIMQTILAVIALFTGALALYATMTESFSIRKQTAASVWPHVQIGIENYDLNTNKMALKITMKNAGVGPAKIIGFRFGLNNEIITTWDEFLRTVDPEQNPQFVFNSVTERVMTANETVELLSVFDEDVVIRILQNMDNVKYTFEYCYCSIFDDCWIASLSGAGGASKTDHQPVENCPAWGDEGFKN